MTDLSLLDPFSESGYTGLAQFSGIIQQEFLRELRGREAYKRFDEMRRNSAPIGALLLAIENAIRGVKYTYVSDLGESDPRIQLCKDAEANLEHTLLEHVIEMLTMLPFGFSIFEMVFEYDFLGRPLWKKFAPRSQDTVFRWLFDTKNGGALLGFEQQGPPTFKPVPLSMDKLILYRTRNELGNPEGRSILRNAWIPYYFCKHIQQIEAIGIERDLAGLPHITLPKTADTSETTGSDYDKAAKLVRRIRNDEEGGVVTPEGWEFELVSTGGSRQFDTDKVITRYETRELMSALAQFLILGQNGVGSLALSKDQTDFFTMSVNATADIFTDTFTKYAIPPLMRMNGYDCEGIRLEHTPAGDADVNALAQVLSTLKEFMTWTPDDEVWLRNVLRMPERDPMVIQAERDRKAMQAQQIAQASNPFGQQPAALPGQGQQAQLPPPKAEQGASAETIPGLFGMRSQFEAAINQFREALKWPK